MVSIGPESGKRSHAGHSLGGVLAVIAAMDIADLLPWASLQVYTVGAPRPGNRAFSKLYDTKAPDTWHIINERVRLLPCEALVTLFVLADHYVCLLDMECLQLDLADAEWWSD